MDKLRISYTKGAGFGVNWPALCAREKGFYRDEGLDVELLPLTQEVQTAGLLSHDVPVERRGPDEDLVRIAAGAPLRIIAGLVRKPPVTLFARPEFHTIAQLRGQTLAGVTSRFGSSLALRMVMADAGLPDGTYTVKPYGGTVTRYAALQSGEVAATLISPPMTPQAAAAGFVPLAKLTELYPNFLYSSIQVTTSFARQNRELLVRLLRADIRAQQWIYDPANRDEAMALLAHADALSLTDAAACYVEMVEGGVFCHAGEMGPPFLHDLLAGLRRLGDLDRDLQPEDCLDLQYVEEARAQLGIPTPA